MLVPRGDATRDQRLLAREVDETDIATRADQHVTVPALERRARDDAMSAAAPNLVDPAGDRVQPRPTVLVGERDALVHFLDVGGRVKPVAILERPVQAPGEHG